MASTTPLLLGAIGLLLTDSIVELSFISNMVSWLHRRAGGSFIINYPAGSTFSLHGKPVNLLLDQGHTSNGAAGTAFVAIGLGGLLALSLRHRQSRSLDRIHGFTSFLYHFWLVMTVLSAMLSVAAFIFTFIWTYKHMHQTIDLAYASQLDNQPYPDYVAYPLEAWTPENWFDAVLKTPLEQSSDRSDIRLQLALMRGWRWNLIPLSLIGIAVAVLALVDRASHRRRATGVHARYEEYSKRKTGSPR